MNRPQVAWLTAAGAAGATIGVVIDRSLEEGVEPITILTGALVLITAYYAWQNRRVVEEMQRATEMTVEPTIALRPQILVPGKYVMLRAENVGQGPALGLDAQVEFGRGVGGELEPYRWQAPILAAGDHCDLYARRQPRDKMLEIDDLVQLSPVVRLVGCCTDALGRRHEIDARLDIEEWWATTRQAGQRFEKPIGRHLEQIAEALDKIAQDR